MSIKLSMLLTADAAQAKAELKSTGKAADGAGKSVEKMGRKGKTATSSTKALGASASRAKNQVQQLSAAEVQAANTVGKLGAANQIAAGNVGNLFAQLNDVESVMGEMQSSLQGGIRAVGAALGQMINPINLITIGSIAAGAALVGWLRDARPAALSLEEVIGNLSGGIDNYRSSVQAAGLDTAAMIERFGSGASSAKKYLDALIEVRRREALVGAAQVAKSVTGGEGSYGVLLERLKAGDRSGTDSLSPSQIANRELMRELALSYQEIDAVSEQSIATQIAAWERVYAATVAIAESVDGVSQNENERLGLIAEQVLRMQELLALDEASNRAAEAALTAQREKLSEWVASAYDYAAARVQANVADMASGQAMLQKLNEENAIRAAILAHGEGSVQVAQLRAAAERRVFEETLKTKNYSSAVKDEIRAAWEYSQQLANTDIASGIDAAANAAARMANNIARALGAAQSLSAQGANAVQDAEIRLRYADDPVQAARQLGIVKMQRRQGILRDDADSTQLAALDAQAITFGNQQAERARLDKERGDSQRNNRDGGKASLGEREAVKELVRGLEDELAILRETDPVQKEMLKNREALTGATAQERQSIADLIAQRNAETEALERQQELWAEFRNTTYDALDGLIFQGESLADVMDSVAASIQKAVLQAILLGEGPLAGLLGGSGGDGILGAIATAIVPANAEGGMIYGPGSGTSDDILMFGSSGEFMVNAAATKKHRGLLELINAGNNIPGYAAGGYVAPGYMSNRGAANSGFAGAPQIIIENQSSTPITGEIEETVDASGRRSSKLVLADAVGDALTTRGGGANRVMKNRYGLRQQGALR